MPVTYTFGSATSAIPLSQLDSNFATPITIGNVVAQLGNVVSTIGNVTLANPTVSTNLNFSSGTNGIVFNNSGATTNSTLNDYETGTWTPTLIRNSSNPTSTYSFQVGTYTKIGRMVYIYGSLATSTVTGGSGTYGIGSLPFTSTNVTHQYPQISTFDISYATYPSGTTQAGFEIYPNSGYMILVTSGSAVGSGSVNTITGNFGCYFSGCYEANF
jgi:hypothetical protein